MSYNSKDSFEAVTAETLKPDAPKKVDPMTVGDQVICYLDATSSGIQKASEIAVTASNLTKTIANVVRSRQGNKSKEAKKEDFNAAVKASLEATQQFIEKIVPLVDEAAEKVEKKSLAKKPVAKPVAQPVKKVPKDLGQEFVKGLVKDPAKEPGQQAEKILEHTKRLHQEASKIPGAQSEIKPAGDLLTQIYKLQKKIQEAKANKTYYPLLKGLFAACCIAMCFCCVAIIVNSPKIIGYAAKSGQSANMVKSSAGIIQSILPSKSYLALAAVSATASIFLGIVKIVLQDMKNKEKTQSYKQASEKVEAHSKSSKLQQL